MAIFNSSDLDRTFHALGDKTRREMLATISYRKRCTATELAALFDTAQPTISKHLKVLDEAGLVERQIEGRFHFFELRPSNLEAADAWINRHLAFWNSSLDQLGELLDEDKQEPK